MNLSNMCKNTPTSKVRDELHKKIVGHDYCSNALGLILNINFNNII